MNRLLRLLLCFTIVNCMCRGIFSASEFSALASQSETRILTVQDAIQMTLAYSPEVLIAKAQAMRAEEAVRETRSLNLPQVVTGTGLAYNNGYPLSIEGSAPSIFQIGVSQSIFSKKNANLIREAEEYQKAGRIGAESAQNDLAAKTAMVYYELHQSRQAITVTSAGLDAALRYRNLVDELFTAGKVRPVEVTQAKKAVNSCRQQLLVAQEQARVSESELRELAGLSPSVAIQTSEPLIDNPEFDLPEDVLYQKAIEHTPEILRSELNAKAREFHIEAEKGESMPRMDIIGQYALFSRANNYDDYFNRFTRNNFLLGLSLQVPIFNGYRTRARVAQSRQELSEEQHKLQRMKSDLKMNIQRGQSALRIARGACDLARSDLLAAKEMVLVNEALLESGRISRKELEDLRSQLQQKELVLLETDRILFQRKVEMLRALGSLVSSIQ
jgi:outer membrane protein